jgi:hypothetical protein
MFLLSWQIMICIERSRQRRESRVVTFSNECNKRKYIFRFFSLKMFEK